MPTITTTPSILYRSGPMADLKPAGMPRHFFPLPTNCSIQQDAYSFTQTFVTMIDAWTAQFGSTGSMAMNTPSNATGTGLGAPLVFNLNDGNAILTGWSQPRSLGGGLIEFDATFSRIPASWDDFKSLPYTFPGFPGIIGQTGARNIFTDTVSVRVHHDYFVVDPLALANGVVDSSGVGISQVASMGIIAAIKKSFFCVAFGGTPDFTNRTNSLVVSGGATIGGQTYYQTLPAKAHYQDWIAAAAADSWAGTAVWDGVTDGDTNSGSIVPIGQLAVEDSHLSVYAGRIIDRVTMYVLCK